MSKTKLLRPIDAVKMVWAYTVTFSKADASSVIKEYLKEKLEFTEKQKGLKELQYLNRAKIAMCVALRNLEATYKGRNLNFDENEKLREAYLEAVKHDIELGTKFENILEVLPGILTGGAAGAIVGQLVDGIPTLQLVAIIVLTATAGYLITTIIKKNAVEHKKKSYVSQDYERNLYFKHYLKRCKEVLVNLLDELEEIHKGVFKTPYSKDLEKDKVLVEKIVDSQQPTQCEFIDEHFRKGKITPRIWTICETDSKDAKNMCPHWRREKGKN